MIENLYGEARGTDSEDSANPSELSVVAQLANLASPYAIRVAATLRLADLIEAQPRRLDELAAVAGADPDALGRLMRFLTCRGVFAEPEPGVFSMTESARVLTSNHPMQARGWFDLDGPAAGRMDVSFTGLLDAVRTGETTYSKIFGRPAWEDLEDNPNLAATFGALMASRAASFAPDVVKYYDWNNVAHVIDVGGGAGLLLTALLHAHPAMTGTLVDLPAMASLAQTTFDTAGLSHRTSAIEGNIFDPLPPGGDLYLLASILHDWNDQDATKILRRCAEAAGAGSHILVVDRTSDHGNPLTFTFMNLLMLVFLGGRERTLDEFAALGTVTGLTLQSANPTPAGLSLLTFVVN
ncbi:MAG: methyltransferase [Pseudonocardiales bacterium]